MMSTTAVPTSEEHDETDALARAREAVLRAEGWLMGESVASTETRAAAWAQVAQAWAAVGRLELECMAAFPPSLDPPD